ncbi:MAG: ABC transporter ATP-binding protein [Desulfobacterales bacterium]
MSANGSTEVKGAPIKIDTLSKYFGKFGAVKEANLDIKAGEFITFLGPSGSGKTTTLMMVAGFLIPTYGDIVVDNKSIVTVPPHKRNIGMMFQHYALFPHMSVAENIAFPLQMRRMSKDKIDERVNWAVDLVQLSEFKNRRPHQLSGGQQQRVALARAVVFEPSVLLLDEPLGALDAKLRENMQIELKQMHAALGTTVLYVTHDQAEALTLSDRICVFNQGRIMQVGSPDDLYNYPQNRFVADFIGETNFLTGEVVSQEEQTCTIKLDEKNTMKGLFRDTFSQPEKWATFSLRPEKVLVGEAAEHLENSYEGTVQEFLYLGEFTKYRIALSPSIELTVKATNRKGKKLLAKGEKTTVGWEREEILLVESDVPPPT